MASWHQWPQTLCFKASYSLKVTETQLTQAECLPLAGAGSRDPPGACKFTATHPCCMGGKKGGGGEYCTITAQTHISKIIVLRSMTIQTHLYEQYVSESLHAYAYLKIIRKFITQFITVFPYIQWIIPFSGDPAWKPSLHRGLM